MASGASGQQWVAAKKALVLGVSQVTDLEWLFEFLTIANVMLLNTLGIFPFVLQPVRHHHFFKVHLNRMKS